MYLPPTTELVKLRFKGYEHLPTPSIGSWTRAGER